MPKNRTISFGYCMKNGEITTEPKEVYAVVTIFDEYLKGKSLSEIAKLMETEKIRYNADSDKWNKNMVKRIIENEKYLGNDTYPQIIAENIFKQDNEKRVRKATSLNLISDDLHPTSNGSLVLRYALMHVLLILCPLTVALNVPAESVLVFFESLFRLQRLLFLFHHRK